MIELIKDVARGAVIGVANIIPGVSGGTMALVLGIYERFIAAIHNLSGHSIMALVDLVRPGVDNRFEKFKHEFENIDAWFLIKIGIGVAIAIVALARLMTPLLVEWHDPTYGFFWGLVLVSILAPYQLIKKKTPVLLLAGLLGAVAVVAVTGSVPDEVLIERAQKKYERELEKEKRRAARSTAVGTAPSGPAAPSERQPTAPDAAATSGEPATPAGTAPEASTGFQLSIGLGELTLFVVMGAVTISATILPGISGSLLMIIMGGYFDLLRAVSDVTNFRGVFNWALGRGPLSPTFFDSAFLLVAFMIGCGLGLLFFSRLLDYLLHRFHDITMAFLAGLVVGSLWSIWPFKNTAVVGGSTVYLSNIMPAGFGANEVLTLVMMLVGAGLVALMIYLENRFSDGE